VGRTPLREALRLLQREGLVVSEPNRRVKVASLTSADAEDLYIMRISLESMAIRITVPQLGSEGIAQLEGLMAQIDFYIRSADGDGIRGPHRAFHARLVEGAGPRVATVISQLSDHAERYRIAAGATVPQLWAKRSSEHRAILDAAAEEDVDLAERRLIEHYAHTAALIFDGLDGAYDPERLRTVIASLSPGVDLGLLRAQAG
jgi:DNA-binding GntR family transcriptional regulator